MQKVPLFLEIFIPTNYSLNFDLNQKERRFSGVLAVTGTALQSTVSLHAKDLDIQSVVIGDTKCRWSLGEFDALTITLPEGVTGDITLTIAYTGTVKSNLHGLYLSQYEHEGEKKDIFVTQFESHHAREMMPCIDEPAAKATFDVTITTEAGMQVLGNMPETARSEDSDTQTITFDTTPKMSTYLLALVIGDLHCKSAKTANDIDVRVWATPAQRPEALDFALDHAVKTIDFFEEYFGVPYPLPKSDQVALPDFGSGAMENWGLITYRETALLADPATTTVSSKRYIGTVVSHELSHQWFGNLVTMKWWNNLWLNESFATIMEYIAVDAIHPEWNAWLDFDSMEAVMALRRDCIDGVQAVQVDVNHPDEIGTLFDGAIVYAKGARLMRMLRSYVGEDAFRAGLKTYFTEHAYGNTEETDLWRHLSDASGKDVAAFMTPWISQPGYPVLTVQPDELSQAQFFTGPHEAQGRTWPILLGTADDTLPEVMTEQSLEIAVDNTVRFNPSNIAHYITHYPPETLDRIVTDIEEGKASVTRRLQILNEQMLLVRAGVSPSANLIPLIKAYKNETSESVWSMIAAVFGELKRFVEDDEVAETALRALSGEMARPLYDKLGWHPQENESEDDTRLRSTILGMMTYSRNADVLEYIDELYDNNDFAALDAEIRPLILSSVLMRRPDITLVDDYLQQYKTTNSADLSSDIRAGLTSVQAPEQIARILTAFTDKDTVRTQDLAHWFAYMIRNRYARTATWQWMKDNWQWIDTEFSGDKSYDYFPRYAATSLRTLEQLADYSTFFDSMRDNLSLTRTIAMGESEIHARVDLLERDGEGVCNALTA